MLQLPYYILFWLIMLFVSYNVYKKRYRLSFLQALLKAIVNVIKVKRNFLNKYLVFAATSYTLNSNSLLIPCFNSHAVCERILYNLKSIAENIILKKASMIKESEIFELPKQVKFQTAIIAKSLSWKDKKIIV